MNLSKDRLEVLLTEEEREIASSMTFDQGDLIKGEFERARQNGEAALKLLKSLLSRDAISEIRLRYFTDPDLFPGGRGKSRKDIWKGNGTVGDDIARHPNFLDELRYFIYGSNLPPSVIAEFTNAVEGCGQISSSDIVPLGKAARRIARAYGLQPYEAREEFFKLALDIGLWPPYAASIRKAVGQLR
jgi:hypothetical protein